MSIERRFFVKICGLRDVASAQAAVDAGADAIGFILAPSKRQVPPELVAGLVGSLDRSRNHPSIVGVMVNPTIDDIIVAVRAASLETVQLSGDESPEILDEIDVPVIKALRFPQGTTIEKATRAVEPWFAAARPAVRVIVEGHAQGAYGGTGLTADWSLVAMLAERYPVVLAGGLTPENVANAVREARPWGVDVSSGVERDGQKNPEMIRQFVTRAREAYDVLG